MAARCVFLWFLLGEQCSVGKRSVFGIKVQVLCAGRSRLRLYLAMHNIADITTLLQIIVITIIVINVCSSLYDTRIVTLNINNFDQRKMLKLFLEIEDKEFVIPI